VKFEGDRANPLEVMISQTQEFGKAIRPIFADPVTNKNLQDFSFIYSTYNIYE